MLGVWLISVLAAVLIVEVSPACTYGNYEDAGGLCHACSVITGCLNCTSAASCKLCA